LSEFASGFPQESFSGTKSIIKVKRKRWKTNLRDWARIAYLKVGLVFPAGARQKVLTKNKDVLDYAATGVLTSGYSARFMALRQLFLLNQTLSTSQA
jgi:hypothetical protein